MLGWRGGAWWGSSGEWRGGVYSDVAVSEMGWGWLAGDNWSVHAAFAELVDSAAAHAVEGGTAL